eukprot:scaffold8686_cov57-Phaeocystis_antarctica.AAC.3
MAGGGNEVWTHVRPLGGVSNSPQDTRRRLASPMIQGEPGTAVPGGGLGEAGGSDLGESGGCPIGSGSGLPNSK